MSAFDPDDETTLHDHDFDSPAARFALLRTMRTLAQARGVDLPRDPLREGPCEANRRVDDEGGCVG